MKHLTPQEKKELRFILTSFIEVVTYLAIAFIIIYLIFKK